MSNLVERHALLCRRRHPRARVALQPPGWRTLLVRCHRAADRPLL